MTSLPRTFALLTLASLTATAARAQDAIVPDDFASIQAAVSQATDVDSNGTVEIFVRAGTYMGNVRITRSDLSLEGEDAATTTIVGTGTVDVLRVEAFSGGLSNVTLRNLGVTGGGATFDGIELRRVTNGVVDGCLAFGNADGIRLNGTAGSSVTGSLARDNASDGIKLSSSTGFSVTGNEARDNGSQGLDLTRSTDGAFMGNTSTSNGSNGLRIRRSQRVMAGSNVLTGNLDNGVRVRRSSELTIMGNTATGNLDNGFRARDSFNSLVTLNAFDNNSNHGLRLRDLSGFDFSSAAGVQGPMGDNTATGNGSGPLRVD